MLVPLEALTGVAAEDDADVDLVSRTVPSGRRMAIAADFRGVNVDAPPERPNAEGGPCCCGTKLAVGGCDGGRAPGVPGMEGMDAADDGTGCCK